MIYAIADLHLSFAKSKPMDAFGPVWRNHPDQIENNWNQVVSENDLVIVPGDVSWATRARDASVDLKWLSQLPGTKLIIKGNHDYWWSTMSKAKRLMPSRCHALLGGIFIWSETIIVGIRGWVCPGETNLSKKDRYIYERECAQLKKLLETISTMSDEKQVIVAMHYPPFNYLKMPSGFTRLMTAYNVDLCIYGHLHDKALRYVHDGIIDNVEYFCVSADKLKFKPEPLRSKMMGDRCAAGKQHVFTL